MGKINENLWRDSYSTNVGGTTNKVKAKLDNRWNSRYVRGLFSGPCIGCICIYEIR